jgi:DNA replication licensing factor MCM2
MTGRQHCYRAFSDTDDSMDDRDVVDDIDADGEDDDSEDLFGQELLKE